MSADANRAGQSRLSRFVGLPEGLTARDALLQAGLQLEAHRDNALTSIDTAILGMEAFSRDAASTTVTPSEARKRLFDLAYDVAGIAGLVMLDGLGAAARSLCDLIERSGAEGVWNAAGVEVHLKTIQLLRHRRDLPAHIVGEILSGLGKIVVL